MKKLLVSLLLLLLTGCSLAQPGAERALSGVLVTREGLEAPCDPADADGWLLLEDRADPVFQRIDRDAGRLEATLLVPGDSESVCFYFHPVYTAEDGGLLAEPGSGLSMEATPGGAMTQSVTETETEQGSVREQSIFVHTEAVSAPEQLTLLCFDGEQKLLCRDGFTPETLPDAYRVPSGTSHVVLEQHCGDKALRSIHGPAEALPVTVPRGDGFCTEQTLQLQPQ